MLPLARPTARADFAAKAQKHLDELRDIDAGGTSIASNHFESRALWKVPKHKEELVADSRAYTKCAWCELHYEKSREINVEHYRPKAAVTRWNGSPPLVSDTPPKEIHVSDGYWWLAFDWNNYSPACTSCNQTWKRNLFPVRDPRASYGEGMEAREVALLIDPMSSFRTADHFSWTPLGIMNAESERGEATIITCGLNRRLLVARRERTAKNVIDKIDELFTVLSVNGNPIWQFRELRELGDPKSEFAGMNRWLVERTMRRTWDEIEAAAA